MSTAMQIPEIGAAELARELEAGTGLQVLDIRAPERLAQGRIDICPPADFKNMAGSLISALPDPALIGLDKSRSVVCVCGHGNSSLSMAGYLRHYGFNALSLRGGMAAWMNALIPRELAPPPGFDRLIQFDRVGKGALGYLLISAGEALVIDPPLNTDPYERSAEEAGAEITAVADTHVHADYVSGASMLSAKHGAPYYLHPADNCFPFDGTPGRLEISPLRDADRIGVGEASLRVMHTPGHTEGSVCLIAGGQACFSGDFVFISSIGRPDLAGRSAEWTPQLYASLERARAEWPDSMVIYPAHYGEADERNADRSVGQSFGAVKARSSALRISDPAQFSAWVESHLSQAPAQYRTIKGVNAGLINASEEEIEALDAGRNECALR